MDYLTGLWQDMQPYFVDTNYYIRVGVGVLMWYLMAWGISHLLFGAGQDAVPAAINASWIAVLVVTALAVGLGIYVWSSVALGAALGLLVFFIPVILTLVFSKLAQTK